MQPASHTLDIIYCHGVPGSSAEIETLIPEGGLRPHVLEPLDLDGFDAAILKSKQNSVHIVGFSLGAMTALRIAALRPMNVKKMTLIAPAAPLELGDFLPFMAGRPVFDMALKGSIPFNMFTALQRVGVALAPKYIIKTMFSGSPEADMALLSNATFEKALISGLKSSLGWDRQSYRGAVHAYVRPWAHYLKDIKCPVDIYHGSEDNWAPVEMAYALKRKISPEPNVIICEKLGHYSTLQKALPIILHA